MLQRVGIADAGERLGQYPHEVEEVSFELQPGETLGLVGESGCGKTTAGRTILRAYPPTRGRVLFRDGGAELDLAALPEAALKPLRTRLQMIFQDPFSSLNPRMTVRDLVAEPLVIHRLARGSELEDRVAAMLRRVGLRPEHRTRYPHAFSGGQRQRIGIARALIAAPRLVVCDEAVSALDVSVQAQVINLRAALQEELGLTYLFIAHDLSVVRHISDRVAVMYAGRLVELAPAQALFAAPRHPYTRALLAAVPQPDPDVPPAAVLAGEVADPGHLPSGCPFHPRCPLATARCRAAMPELRAVAAGWTAACHEV
ncbi:MAG: oligopeptide/dipeptide ABC transporter ATP-binding protein [Gemmatimonadota bacterium]